MKVTNKGFNHKKQKKKTNKKNKKKKTKKKKKQQKKKKKQSSKVTGKIANVSKVFLARRASFGSLSLISDLQTMFRSSQR